MSRSKEQVASLKTNGTLFSRLYIACQARQSNRDSFFEHENQACLPSISDMGQLLQGSKSDLMECLTNPSQSARIHPGIGLGLGLGITTEIKRITRRKQRAYNRCTNKPITSREHRKYKELQKQTKELCKSAYNTYINNLISPDNSTNPKRLYSYIKNQRKDQSGIQQLQDKDGFIRSDSLTKANILNQHFQSVFTHRGHFHHTRQRH